MRKMIGMAALVVLAACAGSGGGSGGSGTTDGEAAPPAQGGTPAGGEQAGGGAPAQPPGQEGDSARIARLEREARALAKAGPCEGTACRTAPVGSRPCGGPREYIVYCATRTDSAALFAKLDELARVEQAYNEARGLMSTCEFRSPPGTELVGNQCRATQAAPGPQ